MKRLRVFIILIPLVIVISGCFLFNKLPLWSAIPEQIKNIGDLLTIDLTAYCTDPDGDSLSFSLVSGPGAVGVTTYSWTVTGPVGDVIVTLRASDGKGSSEKSFTIKVKGPPDVPSFPTPTNGAVTQEYPNVTLSWNGDDPDGDAVAYDLYFGEAPNPPIYSIGLTNRVFVKGNLKSYTKYYWKIVAKDGEHTVSGPIWSFTTKAFEIVNDDFESRAIGILTDSTLPWANYVSLGTSYAYIGANLGYNNSRGLTFADPTVPGFAGISRYGLEPLKKGSVFFQFRVTAGGSFGFRDDNGRAPYVLTGDFGSGYGLYSYNKSIPAFTKVMNITANTWYSVYIDFDFTPAQNRFRVFVNDNLMQTVNLTGTNTFTSIGFFTFVDTACEFADLDNVVIKALESDYSTSSDGVFEALDGSRFSVFP